jgi:8-oxo-dGTP diphosphatase
MTKEPFRGFRKADFLGVFGFFECERGVLLVANERPIDGRPQLVWDLPGGRVEDAETLREALRREMREECGIEVSIGDMLFLAEGERVRRGERTGVWRSFFFAVDGDAGSIDISGEPAILDYRFVPRDELAPLLFAPYHKGFLEWLATGARYVFDRWED